MESNHITQKIIGCAIEVHKILGPGLFEATYEECLAFEMKAIGLDYKRQVGIPVIYKDVRLEIGYRMDFLVENKVVVELKAQDVILDIHKAQTLTYMRFSEKSLGLLINFNVPLLIKGIQRFVL
jgi:GxxExxY protein